MARLEKALKLLQDRSAPAVGVVDPGGRLVGYITSENIGELMMMQNAGLSLGPRAGRPGRCFRNEARPVAQSV
jgi:hypothetical protein